MQNFKVKRRNLICVIFFVKLLIASLNTKETNLTNFYFLPFFSKTSKLKCITKWENKLISHIFQAQTNLLGPTRTPDATATAGPLQVMYPGLAEYMGLELSDDVIRQNMPEYLEQNRTTALIQLPQVMPSFGILISTLHFNLLVQPVWSLIVRKCNWQCTLPVATN